MQLDKRISRFTTQQQHCTLIMGHYNLYAKITLRFMKVRLHLTTYSTFQFNVSKVKDRISDVEWDCDVEK
jgi:hypothetical protein